MAEVTQLVRGAAVMTFLRPWLRSRLEMLLQPLPALEVFMLQDAGVHRELGGAHDELRFEHEGQRVVEVLRLQLGVGGALEGLRIGPWPAMQLCRLAPPGRKPSALASYAPKTRPMNSFIRLRWNHGGRKVCSATSQRGGKMAKSQFAVPGTTEGAVSTV